ncbi:MAG: metal ABC transporter permease [Proteobacteria bacterium]|nr:metal ABC transporter permease [Pseudomonadota bacterium]
MFDVFAMGFMQRALLAGVVVSLLLGGLSVFVVLRRLSFVGVGVSHAAFGGIALGFWLGVDPTLSGVLFALAVGLLIGWAGRSGRIKEDTAIGIFFAAAMALGAIFLALSARYNADVMGTLFGDISAIWPTDVWLIAGVGVIVGLFLILFFKELVYTSFDPEMARVAGVPVTALDYLLLCALALSVVIGVKVVGIVLLAALLVAPAAVALLWSRTIRGVVFLSLSVALGSTLGGLVLSVYVNLPSGATIVCLITLVFVASLSISRLKGA